MATQELKQLVTPELEDVKILILEFCLAAKTKEEILQLLQVEVNPIHHRKYITKLVNDRYLLKTNISNPRAYNQQYLTTRKGNAYLKALR